VRAARSDLWEVKPPKLGFSVEQGKRGKNRLPPVNSLPAFSAMMALSTASHPPRSVRKQ
jgi:hypothetical protein